MKKETMFAYIKSLMAVDDILIWSPTFGSDRMVSYFKIKDCFCQIKCESDNSPLQPYSTNSIKKHDFVLTIAAQ